MFLGVRMSDYCPEEEEAEEEEDDVVSGPICEVCKKSSDSIFECYIKKELRGRYEMVKVYLCARHYAEMLGIFTPPPPPKDDAEGLLDELKEFMEHFGEGDEDDDDDEDWGKMCNVDRKGQSFG